MKGTFCFAAMVKALFVSTVLLLVFSSITFADEDSFKVHNNSGIKITQILVSEDGQTWGNFDIGSGINPGATVELVWDESTEDEDCKQYFKAVFSDGSESDPSMFDFCEPGLTLEFQSIGK